jgi:multidrug efflux pump subunit AcrB
MEIKRIGPMGAVALSISTGIMAGEMPATVVYVHYSVQENDTEQLEKNVLDPVMRSMRKLDRVMAINSTTTHGAVNLEVGFQGNATAQDLVAVTAQIGTLKIDEEVAVLSRVIELRPARSLSGP